MKNKILIFLAILSLAAVFTSCETEGEKVYFNIDDVVSPTLVSLPDMDLKLANANDTLLFVGTPLLYDFPISVSYYLEVCEAANGFVDVVRILNLNQDTAMKITVGELNNLLIRTYPEFETISMDFRIRGRLVVDAGRDAPGSPTNPYDINSNELTDNVTTYGLPRIDVLGSGTEQVLKLSGGDNVYSGLIKLVPTSPFTLFDPATQISYGGSDGTLVSGGAAIVPETEGWHKITVDLDEMTYELGLYSIGIVGAFTEWGTLPDIMLDYDAESDTWSTTTDLPTGPMKFRLNSDWTLNWGPGIAPDTDVDLPDDGKMDLLNEWGNINIVVAGNYDIELTIDGTKGSVVFTLNE
jgi:hypothetical protein